MDFDFHQLYATYATGELIKIIAAPHQYQPLAVKAAMDILATRNADEVKAAEYALHHSVAIPAKNKPEGKTHDSIFDEEEPVVDIALINRYRIIIMASIGIMVSYGLYWELMTLWYLRNAYFLFLNANTLFTVMQVAGAVAVIGFALRKRAGGILMAVYVADILFSCLLSVT